MLVSNVRLLQLRVESLHDDDAKLFEMLPKQLNHAASNTEETPAYVRVFWPIQTSFKDYLFHGSSSAKGIPQKKNR